VKETLSTAVKPAYLRVSDSTVIMSFGWSSVFLREERSVRRSGGRSGVHAHGWVVLVSPVVRR
jgi:hypothetical protein